MRLKHPLLFLLCCLICISAVAQEPVNTYASLFQQNKYLKDWASKFPHFQLSDFRYAQTDKMESYQDANDLQPDKHFEDLYGKLISYTADKKKYLDFYSYQISLERVTVKGKKVIQAGVDVHQVLLLGDYRKKTLSRIMQVGPDQFLEEAVWLSDSTFLLVGTNSMQPSYTPFMYVGDLKKQQYHLYLPKNKSLQRPGVYKSLRWQLLGTVIWL
ncbi:hypothetical protein [Chitinophaga arvensicola]|uniref:Uncharacterized protein n=1 Tax=Chitinophaga arvensicola TaxID=29529 RepID=A0A1I0S7I0_9BACT|nr:hypothetical protein [Chitinophaga arvensicola]SEW51682.1 hypothetical protein SAMN04488122_4439 [Chitinophaga arvensicola]